MRELSFRGCQGVCESVSVCVSVCAEQHA